MFKKNYSISRSAVLSGKDAKALRAQAVKLYPRLEGDGVALLLPPKASVLQTRLASKAVVFGLEGGDPMFFDPTGFKDTLIPTVYALALIPDLVPRLDTHPEVSGRILGGADLFLQGLISPPTGPPTDFLRGSVRSLGVPGNAVPFAVGQMAVSAIEAAREGWKGSGLNVHHAYGDLLWQTGSKVPPNAGFAPGNISPCAEAPQAAADAAAVLAGLDLGGEGGEETAAGGADEDVEAASDGGNGAGDSAAATAPASSPAEMDALLEQCVLGGLHLLKSGQLPMQPSDFYTKCMIPANAGGAPLDLKRSSYKKLSRLLDAFEKRKLLTQKVIRKQDNITAVDREHADYKAYRPAAAGGGNGGGSSRPAGAGASSGASPAAGASRPAASSSRALRITRCYRVPSTLRAVWGGAAGDREALFTEEEALAAMVLYAQEQNLLSADGKLISVDAKLRSLLFNKKEEVPAALPRAALGARYLAKLTLWHRIVKPGDAPGAPEVVVDRKGPLQSIAIASEKRRGHPVTVVRRVEAFGLVPTELASALQKQFQTSCKVGDLPDKAGSDAQLTLMGDLARGVADFLANAYAIPPAHIEVATK